jgi:hypothetical protein
VKLRVYLDTSVLSVAVDERSPERRELTEMFFARAAAYDLSVSEMTVREIDQTGEAEKRGAMRRLLVGVQVHPITESILALARRYRDESIFSPAMEQDSIHVAAAVLTRQDVLLSWNFKHLVNRRRRGLVNQFNLALGLPEIEILAPPELRP